MQSSIFVPSNPLTSLEDSLLSLAASDTCSGLCFYLLFQKNKNTCCYFFESGTFCGFFSSNGAAKLEEIFCCSINVPISCFNKEDIDIEKKRNLNLFQEKKTKGINMYIFIGNCFS